MCSLALLVEVPPRCPPAPERPCLPTIASPQPQASHGSIERERNPRARPIRIVACGSGGIVLF